MRIEKMLLIGPKNDLTEIIFEETNYETYSGPPNLESLLVWCGVFKSKTKARQCNYFGEIRYGVTELFIGKMKHWIYVYRTDNRPLFYTSKEMEELADTIMAIYDKKNGW